MRRRVSGGAAACVSDRVVFTSQRVISSSSCVALLPRIKILLSGINVYICASAKRLLCCPTKRPCGERRRGDTSTGEAGDAKSLSPCIILTLLPYSSKLCEICSPLKKKKKKKRKAESHIITTPALSQWEKKGNSAQHTRGLCSVDKCRSKGARFHGFSWKIETSKTLQKTSFHRSPKG